MAAEPVISDQQLNNGLSLLAEVLSLHNIHYAVIGGMAAGFRSQPRFTKDLDILLTVPQLKLPSLLAALREKGFQFDEITTIREWTQHHLTTLSFQGVRIDWLKPVIPAYQHVLDRAVEENWLARPIRVATVEGLILLKPMAFRTQDQFDIENLVAAHFNALDLNWIRSEWQSFASLDDPRMVRLMELTAAKKPQ